MRLRELHAPLAAALERLQATPEVLRPCVVVERGWHTGIFIQYYGGYGRPLVLQVCLNPDTRAIPGFEEAAVQFFGTAVRINECETFGDWSKECESVAGATESGITVFRRVLAVDWGDELTIEEFVQSKAREGAS